MLRQADGETRSVVTASSITIGTILDPKGKAIAAIAKGESYFGEADIPGKPYVTGYEPATITRRLPPQSISVRSATEIDGFVRSASAPPQGLSPGTVVRRR